MPGWLAVRVASCEGWDARVASCEGWSDARVASCEGWDARVASCEGWDARVAKPLPSQRELVVWMGSMKGFLRFFPITTPSLTLGLKCQGPLPGRPLQVVSVHITPSKGS
jgi:hypothetical protein